MNSFNFEKENQDGRKIELTIIDNYYVDEIVSFMYKFNFSLDEWIEGVGNMEMKKKLEGFQF